MIGLVSCLLALVTVLSVMYRKTKFNAVADEVKESAKEKVRIYI